MENRWIEKDGIFCWSLKGQEILSGYAAVILSDGVGIDTRTAERVGEEKGSFRDHIGEGTCTIVTYRTGGGDEVPAEAVRL